MDFLWKQNQWHIPQTLAQPSVNPSYAWMSLNPSYAQPSLNPSYAQPSLSPSYAQPSLNPSYAQPSLSLCVFLFLSLFVSIFEMGKDEECFSTRVFLEQRQQFFVLSHMLLNNEILLLLYWLILKWIFVYWICIDEYLGKFQWNFIIALLINFLNESLTMCLLNLYWWIPR